MGTEEKKGDMLKSLHLFNFIKFIIWAEKHCIWQVYFLNMILWIPPKIQLKISKDLKFSKLTILELKCVSIIKLK